MSESNHDQIPYLTNVDQWAQYEIYLGIYLSCKKCSNVLKPVQVEPALAGGNAVDSVKAAALAKRNDYLAMQEMSFGLIAHTLSRCDTLLADVFKNDPTLRPGGGADDARPNGSNLWKAVKTYVLQNKAGGMYATYDLKLKSLRLEQFKNANELIKQMDNLYVLVEEQNRTTDGTKILQLGIALGKSYSDFMRNNAYQVDQTYAKLCQSIRIVTAAEAATEIANSSSSTEQSNKKSFALDENKQEEVNYSSDDQSSSSSFKKNGYYSNDKPKGILKDRYQPRHEYKRTHPNDYSRSRSRSYSHSKSPDRSKYSSSSSNSQSHYRQRNRDNNRSNSRSPYRGRGPGSDKRTVRWEEHGRDERNQRNKTNKDHYLNEVVQASKRDREQCHKCRGYGHHQHECPSNNRR
jgi:hypothetical protein